MKVLSIRQPWASLIAYGYKEYEFRSWKTKYRGEFLIHASQSVEKENMQKFAHLNIPFETGKIIAKGYIDDVLPVEELKEKLLKKDPLIYGNLEERGNYGFHIKDIELIDPVEVKGKLGFWNYEVK